jgi:peptidoglycan biosynthesis protein MviN/MurJ (putative lipid II flippase)
MPLTRPSLSQLWSSTLMVMGLALLAKLCGALKGVAMAHHLGTSVLVDQFVFAFSVATWPAAVAGSILTISLTPLLAKLQRRNDSATQSFMAQLWGGSMALSLLVALVFGCVFPMLSPLAASGGTRLAVMVGVVTFLSCLTTLVTIILMCHGRQIGTLLEGLPSLTLGALLVLGLWPHDASLVYGLVFGMALQLGSLWVVHHRHIGAVSLAIPQAGPQWTALGAGLGYTTAGYAILSSAPMIELWIASRFETGSVASLGQLVFIGQFGAVAVADVFLRRVGVPYFSARPIRGRGRRHSESPHALERGAVDAVCGHRRAVRLPVGDRWFQANFHCLLAVFCRPGGVRCAGLTAARFGCHRCRSAGGPRAHAGLLADRSV